jgi:hypothetical protein
LTLINTQDTQAVFAASFAPLLQLSPLLCVDIFFADAASVFSFISFPLVFIFTLPSWLSFRLLSGFQRHIRPAAFDFLSLSLISFIDTIFIIFIRDFGFLLFSSPLNSLIASINID